MKYYPLQKTAFTLKQLFANEHELSEKKNQPPNVGLEPTTLGLRVPCSTD